MVKLETFVPAHKSYFPKSHFLFYPFFFIKTKRGLKGATIETMVIDRDGLMTHGEFG